MMIILMHCLLGCFFLGTCEVLDIKAIKVNPIAVVQYEGTSDCTREEKN